MGRHSRKLALTLATLALAAGCESDRSKQPTEPAPSSTSIAQATAAAIRQQRPDVRVGRVTQVLPDKDLAEVVDLPADAVQKGTAITFINATQDILAHGKIEEVMPDRAFVSFQLAEGGRRPAAGDLVLVFE